MSKLKKQLISTNLPNFLITTFTIISLFSVLQLIANYSFYAEAAVISEVSVKTKLYQQVNFEQFGIRMELPMWGGEEIKGNTPGGTLSINIPRYGVLISIEGTYETIDERVNGILDNPITKKEGNSFILAGSKHAHTAYKFSTETDMGTPFELYAIYMHNEDKLYEIKVLVPSKNSDDFAKYRHHILTSIEFL